MKNFTYLFFLTFCFCGFLPGNAQSLSFSRVKMISSVEDTVPAGKVWKMESILTSYYFQYGGGSSCTNDVNAREVWINGASKIIQGQGVGTGSTNIYLGGYSMPFWIPAGTRVRTTCATTLLSIIEFNIVP